MVHEFRMRGEDREKQREREDTELLNPGIPLNHGH